VSTALKINSRLTETALLPLLQELGWGELEEKRGKVRFVDSCKPFPKVSLKLSRGDAMTEEALGWLGPGGVPRFPLNLPRPFVSIIHSRSPEGHAIFLSESLKVAYCVDEVCRPI